MISSCFELIQSVQQDDVLNQMKTRGDIEWVATTQDGWEFGVIFPDFESIRGLFEYLLDQHVEFDVHWIVKDHNPFPELH